MPVMAPLDRPRVLFGFALGIGLLAALLFVVLPGDDKTEDTPLTYQFNELALERAGKTTMPVRKVECPNDLSGPEGTRIKCEIISGLRVRPVRGDVFAVIDEGGVLVWE